MRDHVIPTSLRVSGVQCAHHLDVRPLTALGRDPFDVIVRAAAMLAGGEALHLITVVEPRSLYTLMRRRGFSSYTTCEGADHHIWFYRDAWRGPSVGVGVDHDLS